MNIFLNIFMYLFSFIWKISTNNSITVMKIKIYENCLQLCVTHKYLNVTITVSQGKLSFAF